MSVAVNFALFNAVYLLAGCGVLWLIGLDTKPRTDFLLLAYAAGVAGTGIAVALLALVDAVPGRRGFVALTACLLAAGRLRRRSGQRASLRSSPWSRFDVVAAVVTAGCLVVVTRRFWDWPLGPWDGWAIWSLKAHALYSSGGVSSPVFQARPYPHPDYPLLLPGLEATWLHFVGRYSGELLHLQLVSFLGAFGAAFFVVLRSLVPSPLRGLLLIAAVTAPEALGQLVTNYADAPLAFFVAVGVLCLAGWLTRPDQALVRLAPLFLGAATLTKDEGVVFVAAAFIAAASSPAAAGRRAVLGRAAVATLLPVAIWRAHTTFAGLTDSAYNTSLLHHPIALAHRFGRVSIALEGLASHSLRWDYLLIVPVIATAVAVGRRRYFQLAFALEWTVISIAGLTVVYWISVVPIHWHVETSANRVVASLAVGLLALTAVLVAEPVRNRPP